MPSNKKSNGRGRGRKSTKNDDDLIFTNIKKKATANKSLNSENNNDVDFKDTEDNNENEHVEVEDKEDNNENEHVEVEDKEDSHENEHVEVEDKEDSHENEHVEVEDKEDSHENEHVEVEDKEDNNENENVEVEDKEDNNENEHVEVEDKEDNNENEHVEVEDKEDNNENEHVEVEDKEEDELEMNKKIDELLNEDEREEMDNIYTEDDDNEMSSYNGAKEFVLEHVKNTLDDNSDMIENEETSELEKLISEDDEMNMDTIENEENEENKDDNENNENDDDDEDEDEIQMLKEIEELKNNNLDNVDEVEKELGEVVNNYNNLKRLMFMGGAWLVGLETAVLMVVSYLMMTDFNEFSFIAFVCGVNYYMYGLYSLMYMLCFSGLIIFGFNISKINELLCSFGLLNLIKGVIKEELNLNTIMGRMGLNNLEEKIPYYSMLVNVFSYMMDVMKNMYKLCVEYKLYKILDLCEYGLNYITNMMSSVVNNLKKNITNEIKGNVVKYSMRSLMSNIDNMKIDEMVRKNRSVNITSEKIRDVLKSSEFEKEGTIEKSGGLNNSPQKLNVEEEQMAKQMAMNMMKQLMSGKMMNNDALEEMLKETDNLLNKTKNMKKTNKNHNMRRRR
jgi:hypothetical protein